MSANLAGSGPNFRVLEGNDTYSESDDIQDMITELEAVKKSVSSQSQLFSVHTGHSEGQQEANVGIQELPKGKKRKLKKADLNAEYDRLQAELAKLESDRINLQSKWAQLESEKADFHSEKSSLESAKVRLNELYLAEESRVAESIKIREQEKEKAIQFALKRAEESLKELKLNMLKESESRWASIRSDLNASYAAKERQLQEVAEQKLALIYDDLKETYQARERRLGQELEAKLSYIHRELKQYYESKAREIQARSARREATFYQDPMIKERLNQLNNMVIGRIHKIETEIAAIKTTFTQQFQEIIDTSFSQAPSTSMISPTPTRSEQPKSKSFVPRETSWMQDVFEDDIEAYQVLRKLGL